MSDCVTQYVWAEDVLSSCVPQVVCFFWCGSEKLGGCGLSPWVNLWQRDSTVQVGAARNTKTQTTDNWQLFPTEAQQNRTNCIGPRLGREPSVADLSTQWRTICLPVWSFTQSDIVRVWECPKSTAWHVKFTKCLRGLLQNVNMLLTTYDHILIFGAAGAQGGNQLTHFGSATSWDPNGELSGRTHVLLASPLKVLVNHTVVLCSSAKHKTHNKLKSKGHNLVLSILDVSCLKFYVL